MAYYSKGTIAEVKKMDLLTCLENYEPYELVKLSDGIYTTKKHDTLQDFREELLKQNEVEAQELALAIELFSDGSLDTFAKPTNVDTNDRLVCYDILDLGEQLLPVGMLVVLDNILNRITSNRRKGRTTYIFIDEIYLLFAQKYTADFLYRVWKKVRKYGAFATDITQNVGDMLQSHTASTNVIKFGICCYAQSEWTGQGKTCLTTHLM